MLFRIFSVWAPQSFLMTPVTNYMLLYSTLLCKNNAPRGRKTNIPTKLGAERE